ncbi:MAG: hypothetical protein UT39_C0012G0014 [Candidatus Woesebacteria bacterium GW2011_GWA1_39_21]|uniref:HEAT repeat domain-containing protein n=1 Tax=Candidatus Woesebacteria bacterium GW2011_GWA1_39_21 TaxID=1618550 RepID=A0A0G0RB96_9BACT|nr:MAG: hypothetical protein UT39_C0012G0014 [Candidatus Woesebacteria bacterium GW2011_GWA1_39_21]
MKKWVSIGVGGIIFIAFLLYIITSLWIGSDVRRYCKSAIRIYGDGCVFALSEMLDDKSMPFRDRNHAIWALGQLADPKALPYLTKYYTGVIPEKESLDGALSQREISKAIRLAQGSLNITAIVWRHEIK